MPTWYVPSMAGILIFNLKQLLPSNRLQQVIIWFLRNQQLSWTTGPSLNLTVNLFSETTSIYHKANIHMTKAMISGLRCVNEGHEFLKKTWNPLLCIGALPFLPILMLGWVKNVSFWVIQKSMNFEVKWVENVWCSRAFIFQPRSKCCTILESWDKMGLPSLINFIHL